MIPPENEELNPNEPPEAKAERRAMLEEATARFLAAGGAVKELPACEFTPSKYQRKALDFSSKTPFIKQ